MKTAALVIEHDECAGNPHEWNDCTWQVCSFHRDYSGDKHFDGDGVHDFYEDSGKPKIGLRRQLRCGTAFELDKMYRGEWRLLAGPSPLEGRYPDGLLVWTHGPPALGAKTYDERTRDAQADLQQYNAWMMGEALCYRLDDDDPDPRTNPTLGGCGEIYGEDDLIRCVREDLPDGWRISQIVGLDVSGLCLEDHLPMADWSTPDMLRYELARMRERQDEEAACGVL